MPKRSIFNFEFKVIALMFVIFVIVLVTGITAYFRFSDLIRNISESVRPDNRLVLSHSLKNDLTELSNIAKTHSLTEDNSYRKNYILRKNQIDDKLSKLKRISENDFAEIGLNELDTLIRDRLIVLDGIMYAEDPFRVQTALGKVVFNLETSDLELQYKDYRTHTEVPGNDKPAKSTTIKENVDLTMLRQSNERLEELEKEEEKLLKKMKKAEKRNNSDKVAELDSLLNKRKAEAIGIHKKLTKSEEYEQDKKMTIDKIYKGIEEVSTEELLIEKEIKMAQLELISMDNILNLRIANVFDEFELIENANIAKATKYAEEENEKTNVYIAVFSVFVAILLLLMAYIIIQYVKKNNLYKMALKRSTTETEKLVKTRERLMATISHEIRTPMHAINGFAQQLSKEQLSAQQQEYVAMIRKSSEHLTYLINDVLDLSKLQNGKLKLNAVPFSLKELIGDIAVLSKELLQGKELEIRVNVDAALADFYLGDAYRLRQIFLNLMSNAVKFTQKGSVVMLVTLDEKSDAGHTIRIVVEDTGIGMTESELAKVFNEFEQFNTGVNSKISGTGLGLSITKKLIELHKGNINIKSEKEKGTTVEIVLKLKTASPPEKPIGTLQKHISCSSILIVDDEEYNRKLLKAMLKSYGIDLREASNGKEALEQLELQQVDLILLDSRMPVMDGKQTVQELRKTEQESGKSTNVILLTAAGTETEELLELVDGYVSKPFSEEQLIDEINKVCGENNEMTEAMEQQQEPDHQQPVDFRNLRALSGTDKAFYADMLTTFVSTTSVGVQTMKVAFSNADWELLANEAHKIASPCRHLGALQFHGLLKEVEKAAREHSDPKQIKQFMKQLEEEAEVVLQVVNDELRTIH
ncbi:MAG: response regulator [Crocinitomicaceae bacterium]|nr:response regulator [Crocinitomicaceae bacterium]NGF77274.1 response regulator [Fluviicola sp. SGL-29]